MQQRDTLSRRKFLKKGVEDPKPGRPADVIPTEPETIDVPEEREELEKKLRKYLAFFCDIKLYRDDIPEKRVSHKSTSEERYKCQFNTFHLIALILGRLKKYISEEPVLKRMEDFLEVSKQLSQRRNREIEEAMSQGKTRDEVREVGKILPEEVAEVNAICDYFIEYLERRLVDL